jgi:hypothetical protein
MSAAPDVTVTEEHGVQYATDAGKAWRLLGVRWKTRDAASAYAEMLQRAQMKDTRVRVVRLRTTVETFPLDAPEDTP